MARDEKKHKRHKHISDLHASLSVINVNNTEEIDLHLAAVLVPAKSLPQAVTVLKNMHAVLRLKKKDYMEKGDLHVSELESVLDDIRFFIADMFDNFDVQSIPLTDKLSIAFTPKYVGYSSLSATANCIADSCNKWTKRSVCDVFDKSGLNEPVDDLQTDATFSQISNEIRRLMNIRLLQPESDSRKEMLEQRLRIHCVLSYSGTVNVRWHGPFGDRIAGLLHSLVKNPLDLTCCDEFLLLYIKLLERAWHCNRVPSILVTNSLKTIFPYTNKRGRFPLPLNKTNVPDKKAN